MAKTVKRKAETRPDAAPPARVEAEPARPVQQKRTARSWRRLILWLTFIPCVVLPVVLTVVYYAQYAADRYAAEIKFAVKSPVVGAPSDILGVVTGVSSSGSTTTDSYIVVEFIKSRDLVDALEQRLDIRRIYGSPKADFLMRFDATLSKEDFTDYLQRMISVYYDISSQIITVEVQAFTPEDAKAVAEQVLALCEELVNEISERARLDMVRAAEDAVTRAEADLRNQRRRIAAFREHEQDIDPTRSVEAQQVLLGRLQGALADAETRMATLRSFLSIDAPSIRVLQSQIESLRIQVEEQKAKLGVGKSGMDQSVAETLTSKIGTYEVLSVDLEFLQTAYVSSLASLGAARLEADRQQRYLASFVRPKLPEKAIYPHRILNSFMIFALSLMAWGITVTFGYVVREHMS